MRAILRACLNGPIRPSEPNPSRLILWLPIGLGAGAAAYMAVSSEPPVWWMQAAALGAILLGAGSALVRDRPGALYALALTAALLVGFGLAQGRALRLAPPPIAETDRARTVEGWIETVERGGRRPRLLVRVTALEGGDPAPQRVRVRAALDGFQPGDSVRFRAVLDRPSGPAAPGGYDGARAAWFDGVALSGWTVGRLESGPDIRGDGVERALARFRWTLAERIRQKAGPRTGGLAAALLTGDRSGVSEADAEALRVSGLGHILAISGLHMALFAGGVYFAVRWMLAAIEPFARAHDPRKPAAVIALLAASFYLALSGAAVSTQRAWVMAVVVMGGILLDRRAFSMRALAIAAIGVLCLAPESVVEPGFQMSFAAVAALIAVYEVWTAIRPERLTPPGWIERVVANLGGLTMTSLVAGAATGAFAAFHFQRLATYGFGANLVAMPVFTFVAMPAGVAALALAPFGLDGPALWVMDLGLRAVLAIAHLTTGLAGAAASAPPATGWIVALFGLGFSAAAVGQGAARLAGLAASCAALAAWPVQSAPTLMVTEAGVALARFEPEAAGWQATSTRRGRFETRVFLQRYGGETDGATPPGAPLACDPSGCVGRTVEGLILAVTGDPHALAEDCSRADIVVFEGRAPGWRSRRCAALLLDSDVRRQTGGAAFWIAEGRIVRIDTAARSQGDRLWTRPTEPPT